MDAGGYAVSDQSKAGHDNGRFLGTLANAQLAGQPIATIAANLRAMVKRGELPGLNLTYAAMWIEFSRSVR